METKFVKIKDACADLFVYILFAPRYRRRIFTEPSVREACLLQFMRVADACGSYIEGYEFKNDCVLLKVRISPYISVYDLVKKMKTMTSSHLISHYSEYSSIQSVFTKEFLVSTSPLSEGDVQDYLGSLQKRPKKGET